MSHKSGGYFYCRYTYECPYTDAHGNRHIDDHYDSALYSYAAKQDHKAQSEWYSEMFLPAAEADIQKNFYRDANRNKKGLKYDQFNSSYIKRLTFVWTDRPPTHNTGPLKGKIYGKEI